MKQDVKMETNEPQPQYRLNFVTNAYAGRLMVDLECFSRTGVAGCVHPKSTEGGKNKKSTCTIQISSVTNMFATQCSFQNMYREVLIQL